MYVTVKVMLKKFGERELRRLVNTDPNIRYGDADPLDLEKLNIAIEEANSEIDGYIGSRYPLPLNTIPPFLVNAGCHMARYHASLGELAENNPIRNRYDNAIKTLKEISKGTLTLGGSPAGQAKPVKTASNNVVFAVGRNDFGGRNW